MIRFWFSTSSPDWLAGILLQVNYPLKSITGWPAFQTVAGIFGLRAYSRNTPCIRRNARAVHRLPTTE